MKDKIDKSFKSLKESLKFQSSGLLVAFSLVFVIGLFLIPLPPYLLDVFLVLNIVMALSLLLRGVFLKDIRRFYTFPSILLFSTLLRLALNVSSTRLILTGGHESLSAAGSVIESFGSFVVQNNFLVGLIIFAIIAIVNFLVIAKGSARVAEVSARFSLDALPGKQLAIDADLRSENINSEEASRRRKEISQEAQFFGSMDGAMKFVQGDAIAGFIITFINIVGGLFVGIKAGMNFSEAFSTFGLLTIGDGLVGILPSLIISICAGIVVTNISGSNDGNEATSSGERIIEDLFDEPQAFYITGFVLICLALVPGLPLVPFLVIGILVLFLAYFLQKRQAGISSKPQAWRIANEGINSLGTSSNKSSLFVESASSNASSFGFQSPSLIGIQGSFSSKNKENSIQSFFQLQPLTLELSTEFSDKKEFEEGSDVFKSFFEKYNSYSEDCFKRKGIVLPAVQLSFKDEILSNHYSVFVREKKVAEGSFPDNNKFVVTGESQLRTFALDPLIKDVHPISGAASFWLELEESEMGSLRHLEVEVLNISEYLALKVYSSALSHVTELFGVKESQALIDISRQTDEALVSEVIDKEVLSLSEFNEILKRLIKDDISIRDLKLIFEGILEFNTLSSIEDKEEREIWLGDLKKFLRKALLKTTFLNNFDFNSEIRAFSLSADIEEEFKTSSQASSSIHSNFTISPDFDKSLSIAAHQMFSPALERGMSPIIILCSSDIRKSVQMYFQSKLEGESSLKAISYEEIDSFNKALCVAELQV